MVEYEAKGGCKRQLSHDIDGTSSSSANAPPRKKAKRIKQVAKTSAPDSDSDSPNDASDGEGEANAEEKMDQDHNDNDNEANKENKPAKTTVRRAAATVAKKNISAEAKLSKKVEKGEEESKGEKRKRARKSVGDANATETAPTSAYQGIKQSDLRDEEDLLHTEFVSSFIILSHKYISRGVLSPFYAAPARHLSLPASPGLHKGPAAGAGAGALPRLPQ